ncbi:MAG: DUF5684 domain-containing protein [Terriglobia bacterium]
MKARAKVLARLGMLMGLVTLLIPCSISLAQEENRNPALPIAAMGAFFLVFLLFGLALYVYFALALSTIATKTHTENAWLAWIPIANIVLMLNIAKKPIWWIILFFIPLVGIVISIIVFMAIAEARGKPSWWGIVIIVPLVGLIVPGYLAWVD